MKKEIITGIVGSSLSVVGTASQTNEILQTISLVITIIGGIVSFIVVPLVGWYSKAKKDGKISEEEAQEAGKIIQDGIDKTQKLTEGEKQDGQGKN